MVLINWFIFSLTFVFSDGDYESDSVDELGTKLRHFLRRQSVRAGQLGSHKGGVECYIKMWFEKFDTDNSGDIDRREFRSALHAMLDENKDEFSEQVWL